MKVIVVVVALLTNTWPGSSDTGASLEPRDEESHTPLQRKLLAVNFADELSDDDGDAGDDKEVNSTDIDKPVFAIEVDTDDPQGVFIPLEKLKMMSPGPGVKPRPMVSPTENAKKKDQAVKKRRRRDVMSHHPRDPLPLNNPLLLNHQFLAEKLGFISLKMRRRARNAAVKPLTGNTPRDRALSKQQSKRIRRYGYIADGLKRILRRKRETDPRQSIMVDKHLVDNDADKDSGFTSRVRGSDHRSKEWLKKELHSIETLMNATKRRLSSTSPRDKGTISPQLERDLQQIDHDIHIDLKHVSSKHKQEGVKGGSVGVKDVVDVRVRDGGDHYQQARVQSTHPSYPNGRSNVDQTHGGDPYQQARVQSTHPSYPNGRSNVDQTHGGDPYQQARVQSTHPSYSSDRSNADQTPQESRRRTWGTYSSDSAMSEDTKRVWDDSGDTRGGRVGNDHQDGRFVDSRGEDEQRRKLPDLSRMLDEMEWIKRETDMVRRKTKNIERQLRMRQMRMNKGQDVPYLDTQRERYPENHNHHGDHQVDRLGENDNFHRRTDDIPHRYPHERNRDLVDRDPYRERKHQNKSLSDKKDRPFVRNPDNTLLSTFNRLQHDLKTLKMKMDATEKYDGNYIPPNKEPLSKVPPIFDEKYFRGEVSESEMKGVPNSTVSHKLESKNTKLMHDLGTKSLRKEEDHVENEDFDKIGSDELLKENEDFRVPHRRKRSLRTQYFNKYATTFTHSDQDDSELQSRLSLSEGDETNKRMVLRLSGVIDNLIQLRSKLLLLNRLGRYESKVKNDFWQACRRITRIIQRRLKFFLTSRRLFFTRGRTIKKLVERIIRGNIELTGEHFGRATLRERVMIDRDKQRKKTEDDKFSSTDRKERTEFSQQSKNRQRGLNKPWMVENDKIHGLTKHQEDLVDGKQRGVGVKMAIKNTSPTAKVNHNKKALNDHRTPTLHGFTVKEYNRARLRQTRSSQKKDEEPEDTKKDPISKEEKELTKEFSQLLKLLPESEEEKKSDIQMYRDDMKQEKSFDISQSIRKVDDDEKEETDFLREAVETNYLLANSRFRRNFNPKSGAKIPQKEKSVVTDWFNDEDVKHNTKTNFLSKKQSWSQGKTRLGRSVRVPSSTNITTVTPLGDGKDIGDPESSMARERNIMDKKVLHMMDYYEGKQESLNLRKKRSATTSKSGKSGSNHGQAATPEAWIRSQYDYVPHRVEDVEPEFLDTYFPKTYNALKNARDRLRWFKLLDGEDRLARQIGYLNNMADTLLEDETDPVLMFLDHVKDRKDPDDYRAWVRSPVSDYNYKSRRDHDLLQDAVHDFNNNEHERDSYLYKIRKRRDVRTHDNKGKVVNGVAKSDKDSVGSKSSAKSGEQSRPKDYHYQFDETQKEEYDDVEGDDDDDDDDDDNDGDEKRVGNGDTSKEEVEGKSYEEIFNKNDDDHQDEDEDDDDVDDEKLDGKDKGIEVDDNGREMESTEPFAYIEREVSPKKMAPKEVEYFWGSWSPCSETCGIGQRFRSNMCGQGQPCGGRQASTETEVCADILYC